MHEMRPPDPVSAYNTIDNYIENMTYCISTDHFTVCLYLENNTYNNIFLIISDLLILFQIETENDNNIFPIAASESDIYSN